MKRKRGDRVWNKEILLDGKYVELDYDKCKKWIPACDKSLKEWYEKIETGEEYDEYIRSCN